MQDVICSVKFPCAFECDDVARILNDTDGRVVALRIAADATDITVCQIAADRAIMYLIPRVGYCVCKAFRLFSWNIEHMKRQTLSGLVTNARQALKLLDKYRERRNII